MTQPFTRGRQSNSGGGARRLFNVCRLTGLLYTKTLKHDVLKTSSQQMVLWGSLIVTYFFSDIASYMFDCFLCDCFKRMCKNVSVSQVDQASSPVSLLWVFIFYQWTDFCRLISHQRFNKSVRLRVLLVLEVILVPLVHVDRLDLRERLQLMGDLDLRGRRGHRDEWVSLELQERTDSWWDINR